MKACQGSPKKIASQKKKACDCCGTVTQLGKCCWSCASTVCELCMGRDASCIDCQVAFPVYRTSSSLSSVDSSSSGESGKAVWPLGACARQQGYSESTEASATDIEEDVQFDPRDHKLKTHAVQKPAKHCNHMLALEGVQTVSASCPEFLPQEQQERVAEWPAKKQERVAEWPVKYLEATSTLDKSVTMMICNIPCRLRHEEIVSAVDATGFANTYDFIFVPRGRGSGTIGYAFVQFNNLQDAERFALAFANFQFPGRSSHKKCIVKVAEKQGFNGAIHKGTNFPGFFGRGTKTAAIA